MGSQVAVAEVAVVPTFKGFRRGVSKETDTAAKQSSQGFSRAFAKTGTETGKATGTGFKKAFEASSKGTADRLTKALEADIAKTSRALSAARLKEQDSVGKVRLAERQLAEARQKYSRDSSQVVRAEERLATASRQLGQAHGTTEQATDDLRRAQGELARAADRTGDELAEAGSRGINGFRSNVVGGVKSFALPLVGAFAALGIGNIVAEAFRDAKDFVTQSIDIASDLNESVNAVSVSYGDLAGEILKLGENSAKTFGLSQGDLNAYATQFSAFVKTIAGDGGDVVGTFETLVGRGTDFASVFNLDVADALQLFQSGLAGETEPLRRYGIDLSAAAVEAYALANGIGDGTAELTEAQKQQARYGALLEQTNAVQGDFINTSDELANKNRINAAEWENVQAKIGDAFLPVASQLADILGDDVIPIIAKLAEEEGPALADAFADILPDLTELAKDLLPLLPGLIKSFTDGLPLAIELISLLAPLISTVSTELGGFLGSQTAISEFINGDISMQEFLTRISNLGGGFAELTRWVTEFALMAPLQIELVRVAIKTKIDEVVGFIEGIPDRALTALGDLTDLLFGSGQDLIGGFLRGVTSAPIDATMSGVLREVGDYFPHSPAKKGPFSGSGWADLEKSGEAFWDQWTGGMGGTDPFGGFPIFPDPGGLPGAGSGPAPGSVGRGGPSVSQTNHFDKTDPREGAELANQMLAAALRGA